jgi:hypothetical protein
VEIKITQKRRNQREKDEGISKKRRVGNLLQQDICCAYRGIKNKT